FNLKKVLEKVENEIDFEVQKRYNSPDNIIIIKHDAKQELKENKIKRDVVDYIVINCDETKDIIVPAQFEVRTLTADKLVHFSRHVAGPDMGGVEKTVLNIFGAVGGIIGTNYLFSALKGRDYITQSEELQFDHKVTSITFDKSPDDIRLLDKLTYHIDPQDQRRVKVFAEFSWGGSPVMSWDFDLKVTAKLEQTVVTRPEYKDTIVIPKQRIEERKKKVTDTEQKLVTVKEAYEEKMHKRTKEEIRKSLIQERINKLS
ncbi:unnamed protein product, partial [Adineta steineri]